MRNKLNELFGSKTGWIAAGICLMVASQAMAAEFTFLANDGGNVTFEQRWNQSDNWIYVSGVDDGGNGIPDGLDTFTIDRNGQGAQNNTDLSNEGMPNHSIAQINATGAPGRDIVLKQGANVTITDLIVNASASAFQIFEERDQPLTFDGVISGSGDLEIFRNSGFSNGLQRPDPVSGEDEIILFTGSTPSTYTGNLTLANTNNSSTSPQPAYFVADKIGAFGQAATLRLESRGTNGLEAELQFTINTLGGEGAIDDQSTIVEIGEKGLFRVDTGVNEFIGSGNLMLDLDGDGTFTPVADGVYDNNQPWITGAGTVTVGAACSPGDTDGDGDIDTGDLTTAITNFTGAGGSGKTCADGDTDDDGDVDTGDLTFSITNFTGAQAGNAGVPDLVYDPATGNVTIDADGADVISFSLQSGPFNAADFSELPAGLTDNIASQIGWTSFNLFSGLTGTANLGAILPAGLDQAGLEAALTTASYGLALAGGGGGGRLDLIIPEPASMVLMGLGAVALVRRRRAA